MSGLIVLKDVLDESNVEAVLERAAGLSEPALRELVTRMRMDAARPPQGPAEAAPESTTSAAAEAPVATADTSTDANPAALPAPTPAAEELTALTLWVSAEFRTELAAVRDLVSHAVPSGKVADVLLHALREVRKLQERRRYGARRARTGTTSAPATPARPGSRTIPAAVRRAVDQRAPRSCSFVGAEGKVCGSTWQLQHQHIQPYARGGLATDRNMTLHCRVHNLLQAEKDYGQPHVAARIAEARAPSVPRSPESPAPGPPPRLPAPSPASAHAADAISGLTNLGYRKQEATWAIELALTNVPPDCDLPDLLREGLRRLRRPQCSDTA